MQFILKRVTFWILDNISFKLEHALNEPFETEL